MDKSELLGILCGDPYPFGVPLSFYDLLIFTLGSFVVISILSFYYSRIPKSINSNKLKLSNPIYKSSDIFLESNSNDANFTIAKKTNSIFVKVIVFLLILYIITTPFQEVLRLDSFY